MDVKIKRVYEVPENSDGYRILVDRIWPRGLSKEKAGVDMWLKDAAPSSELRKWFGHDPGKWEVFKKRYFEELDNNPEAIEQIKKESKKHHVTLLFGAKNEEYNNAVALKEYLMVHPPAEKKKIGKEVGVSPPLS
jgi:uncharacterized protein YeaO (DUF488 family)